MHMHHANPTAEETAICLCYAKANSVTLMRNGFSDEGKAATEFWDTYVYALKQWIEGADPQWKRPSLEVTILEFLDGLPN